MSTEVSYILFYLITFITQASGIPLNKGFQLETKNPSGNLPEFRSDWESQDDYDVTMTRRKKEIGNIVREGKLNHVKMFFENLYRYKQNFKKPKPTTNPLLSKGWGAGGMPFNVLYTPNSHQQKFLRFTPKKTLPPIIEDEKKFKEKIKQLPPRGNELLFENSASQSRSDKLGQKPHHVTTPRKHFPAIPHLFASYGW